MTNVVAVFAHPDDELCIAGTLANHSDKGDNVSIVFLTQGGGTSKIDGEVATIKKKRRKQARNAAKVIGANVYFLDIPDTEVVANKEITNKLAYFIKKLKPDILITWNKPKKPGTGHPDHRYTNQIVIDAITHARFNNPNHKVDPYRDRISLYTIQHYESKPENLEYIDVTNQYQRILDYIEYYNEIFGEWDVIDHKTTLMKYFGQFSHVKYAEAVKKLLWRSANKYLT